jgi:FkbM family methyltransferase
MRALTNLTTFFATHPLTRDAQIGAWRRFAAWQVKSRLHDEIVVDWIEGQKLAVRRGMTGATGNIYAGLHEFTDMMLPLHFLRAGDLFLDIGANVGSYTVLAAGVRRAKTWAFEPDPVTVGHLNRNIALNGLVDRVTVHQLALGPSEGTVSFTAGRDTTNRVALPADRNVRTIPQRPLDALIGDHEPVMIKMDVEGYEEHVLRGAAFTLAKPSLRLIEIETLAPATEGLLTGNGFESAYYDPFTRKLSREQTGPSASNSVYVRDWLFVAARLADGPPVKVLGRSI